MGTLFKPTEGQQFQSASSAAARHDLYAEAVHRAVCEHEGSDGFGACSLYAVAGALLFKAVPPGPERWIPQAGTLTLFPDPSDPTLAFQLNAERNGRARGEFHSWIVSPSGIFVDFAARHYRNYVEKMPNIGDEPVRWTRPDPPAYLWCLHRDLPDWVRFRVDQATTLAEHQKSPAQMARFNPLEKSAVAHFRKLMAAG